MLLFLKIVKIITLIPVVLDMVQKVLEKKNDAKNNL